MTRRFLIAAAVLAAGCEQLKAPKRLKELEGRLDELTAQVETLSSKPGASKAKAKAKKAAEPGHDGADDDKPDGDKPDGDKPDADKPDGDKPEPASEKPDVAGDKHDDGDKHGDEPDTADKHDDKPDGEAKPAAAGGHDGAPADAGEPDHESKPVTVELTDAGAKDARSKDERALDDIAKLVAASTNNGKKKKAAEPEPPVDHGPVHWGYDAKIGPPVWGSLDPKWRTCEQGTAQSPIDIEPRAGTASPIVFHYQPTAATVIDNGHTLQVNLAPGNSIEIDDHTYQLLQFHFHTPSEHTIAGEHYPLEVHLVHKDSRGKLAVIGVLYDAGADSRPLGALWPAWPKKVGVEDKLRKPFDPSALLPDTRTLFRYRGSLTTPPCTEGVLWNVMRRTLSESKARLDGFGTHYKINAREVRPLNDRKIE